MPGAAEIPIFRISSGCGSDLGPAAFPILPIPSNFIVRELFFVELLVDQHFQRGASFGFVRTLDDDCQRGATRGREAGQPQYTLTVCAFFDGNIGQFKISEEYIPIFQTLLVTVYGAYFVGRTWEKAKSITNKNK